MALHITWPERRWFSAPAFLLDVIKKRFDPFRDRQFTGKPPINRSLMATYPFRKLQDRQIKPLQMLSKLLGCHLFPALRNDPRTIL